MNQLVALAMPGGPAFVDELRRAWDDGDAVLPVDLRLPESARRALLDELEPSVVVEGVGAGERHRRRGRPVEPGDALVVATSGTTGEPKGVVLTHRAVEVSARATSAALSVDPDRDRWLACLPLSHVGGLSVVTRALALGVPLEVHDGFDAARVSEAAGRGATLVSLVPTALQRIDPVGFRIVLLGGSAPPAERPANVIATYGLTETGSGIVYDGRPLDGIELRIVDGEIHARGPMLLRAYRDGDDPKDPEGWLATGDAGEIEDGRLRVHGRCGDLIITGGENVWPEPIEASLRELPGVADVAVVGRPDAEWGQIVTAVVVPEDPSDPPTLARLREHVGARLPRYCAPRSLELVERLPRARLGKLRRSQLTLERDQRSRSDQ